MEAIQAATGVAARALGKAGDIGALAAGAFGDILVVDGDPLDDIRHLQARERIWAVMLEGRFVAGQAFDSGTGMSAPPPLTQWRPREPER